MALAERPEIFQAPRPENGHLFVGEVRIGETADPRRLEDDVARFADEKSGVLAHAKEKGLDIVAHVASHGNVVKVGAGIAATAAAVAGAIIVYKHEHK